ncbi:MAG: hypothetical protein K6G54_03430, partial [Oscillospiraceae bacterium]|nr:hypothetical protein [Oscillospiraceae bacterium]
PTLVCDAHVGVPYCSVSGMPAGHFCPEETLETHYAVDLKRPNTAKGFGYQRELLYRPMNDTEYANYALLVDRGLLQSMPNEAPIQARDSGAVLVDIQALCTCTWHLNEQPSQEVSTEPVQPTTEPVQPTTEPVQPTTEPVQPTTDPVQPTTEPEQPTVDPEQPTTEPEQPTTDPTQPGEDTGDTTEPEPPETPTDGEQQEDTGTGQPTEIDEEKYRDELLGLDN